VFRIPNFLIFRVAIIPTLLLNLWKFGSTYSVLFFFIVFYDKFDVVRCTTSPLLDSKRQIWTHWEYPKVTHTYSCTSRVSRNMAWEVSLWSSTSNFVCISTSCHETRWNLKATTFISRTRMHESACSVNVCVSAARVWNWNGLPSDVITSPSLIAFKRRLKTLLFSRSFDLRLSDSCS